MTLFIDSNNLRYLLFSFLLLFLLCEALLAAYLYERCFINTVEIQLSWVYLTETCSFINNKTKRLHMLAVWRRVACVKTLTPVVFYEIHHTPVACWYVSLQVNVSRYTARPSKHLQLILRAMWPSGLNFMATQELQRDFSPDQSGGLTDWHQGWRCINTVPEKSRAHTPLWWKPFSKDRHFRVWTSHTWMAGSLPTCTHTSDAVWIH